MQNCKSLGAFKFFKFQGHPCAALRAFLSILGPRPRSTVVKVGHPLILSVLGFMNYHLRRHGNVRKGIRPTVSLGLLRSLLSFYQTAAKTTRVITIQWNERKRGKCYICGTRITSATLHASALFAVWPYYLAKPIAVTYRKSAQYWEYRMCINCMFGNDCSYGPYRRLQFVQ